MNLTQTLVTAVAIAAAFATPSANAQETEQGKDMASYSATYQLSLEKLRVEGWADRAGGTMDVRFAHDCFHWHLDRDIKFVIRFTDGRRTALVVSEKLRETLNGQLFWFWSRTTLNGNTVQIITGAARPPTKDDVKAEKEAVLAAAKAEAEAQAAAEGADNGKPRSGPKKVAAAAAAPKPAEPAADAAAAAEKKPEEEFKAPTNLVAVYDWPKPKRVWMPEHVSFPFTALREQLKTLESGSLITEQNIFDGSIKDGPLRVVYSPVRLATDADAPPPEGETELLDNKTWRFNIDYFPLDGDQKQPLRSSTIKLHANGVISEMVIDLAPFSIKAVITSIKSEENKKACS